MNVPSRAKALQEQVSSYEDVVRASEWLASIPFEHVSRNVRHADFLRRLVDEHALWQDERLQALPMMAVALVVEGSPAGFERTLESLLLQTAPRFQVAIIASAAQRQQAQEVVEARLRRTPFLAELFRGRVSYPSGIDGAAFERSFGEGGYVTCLRAGDLLHPSMAATVYLELRNAPVAPDVCIWNEMAVEWGPPALVGPFVRKPQTEWFTLLHLNYPSYCFAFRTALAREEGDLSGELDGDDLHCFLVRSLAGNRARALTIPQYLLLRDAERTRGIAAARGCSLDRSRSELEARGLLVEEKRSGDGYRVVPRGRSRRVSVVIPFRDRPEATRRALSSVLEQELEGELEIVLVNNRSQEAALNALRPLTERHRRPRAVIRMVDYDRPFNHSTQCNLGVQASTGDVVVFLNNDAELVTPGALEQMASWSLVEGVGTVGIRLVGLDRQTLVSAGITARLAQGPDYHSAVEECRDPTFAYSNRETFGNSFACAAVARRTLERVGPLDEIYFPIGLNDVDYNLRCRHLGLVNIYLGTECAAHQPGGSREHSDEIFQKILLRRRYPWIYSESLFQLQVEHRPAQRARHAPAVPPARRGLRDRIFSWLSHRA
jgi:GT2 family glycosyltransferase